MDVFIDDLFLYMPKYKFTVICGDVNARIGSGSGETIIFQDMITMCDLTLVPYGSTYHTAQSESILDIVASNMNELLTDHGQTSASGFSNHDLIYAVFNLETPAPKKRFVKFRDFNKVNVDALRMDVDSIQWEEFFHANDVDLKLNVLNSLIVDLLDKHAPVKMFVAKHYKAPWMSREVRLEIKNREKARKKFGKSKAPEDFEKYRVLRNRVKQLSEMLRLHTFIVYLILISQHHVCGLPSRVWEFVVPPKLKLRLTLLLQMY
jgi:hypothetical protein